jgi:hypothetical protein
MKPIDNIFKFILAFKHLDVGSSNPSKIEPLDLTNCQELKLVFKSDDNIIEFGQYFTNETVARFGMCQFKVDETKFQDLKNLYKNGNTIFYITTTNQGIRNIIYTGLYTILDTADSLGGQTLGDIINGLDAGLLSGSGSIDNNNNNSDKASIIDPPVEQETAIVTRKKVPVSSGSSFKNFAKNLPKNVSNLINNSASKFKKKK